MKFTPEPIKQDFFKRVSNYTALSFFNSIHRDFKWKKNLKISSVQKLLLFSTVGKILAIHHS